MPTCSHNVSKSGASGYDKAPHTYGNRKPMRSNLIAALILIIVGLFFLAKNLGWINGNIGSMLATWWPAILVAVGIGMLFGRGK